jgi:hypothetical protein
MFHTNYRSKPFAPRVLSIDDWNSKINPQEVGYEVLAASNGAGLKMTRAQTSNAGPGRRNVSADVGRGLHLCCVMSITAFPNAGSGPLPTQKPAAADAP